MIPFEKSFIDIKLSKNPEKINDFLIELGKKPNREHLKYLDYFIKHLEPHIFDKIKLNMIYLIGELGNIITLEDTYLKLLVNAYYNSDRWIRNEIMLAMKKITLNTEVNEEIIKLIGYAINDEYLPISLNALKILLNLKKTPIFIRRNLFLALNSKDFELQELCVEIFEKFLPDVNELFNSLNYSNNYVILKLKAIRTLLLIYFKSVINLESFRKKILASDWELGEKEKYLKEIDTYEKILLKKI